MAMEIQLEVTPARGTPEELVGRARFINTGEAPIAVASIQLESAPLALAIIDQDGNPVPLPPPPVPDAGAAPVELAPGQAHEVAYAGFVPAWTEPGRYRIRANITGHEPAASDWVEVTVTA